MAHPSVSSLRRSSRHGLAWPKPFRPDVRFSMGDWVDVWLNTGFIYIFFYFFFRVLCVWRRIDTKSHFGHLGRFLTLADGDFRATRLFEKWDEMRRVRWIASNIIIIIVIMIVCVVSGSGYFSLFSVVVVVVVMNVYYVSQSDYITVMYYLCLIIVCQTGFIYSLK